MRRLAVVLLAIILLFLSFSTSGFGAPFRVPGARGEFVPDEVLVVFRPEANPHAIARAAGGRVQAELEGLGVHVLKVPPNAVQSVIAVLSRNPHVEFAEPNGYLHEFLVPNDPSSNTQWGWAKVNAYDAWDAQSGYLCALQDARARGELCVE